MPNVNVILRVMNARRVDYLLIGGMNFALNHEPVLTFDVDLWVRDDPDNLRAVNAALRDLEAGWGPTEATWGPVPADPGWLARQAVFCLTTAHGALDIMRSVKGLEDRYAECRAAARPGVTAAGTPYPSLNDEHMLDCQLALAEHERKPGRIATLRAALQPRRPSSSP